MRAQDINVIFRRHYPTLQCVRVLQKFNSGFINDVYLLRESHGEKIVLKIRKEEKYRDLKRNASLLSYLDREGIPVTPLILTKNGKSFVMLRGHTSCEVYRYIEGRGLSFIRLTPHCIREAANFFSRLDEKLQDAEGKVSTFPTGKISTREEMLHELYQYRDVLQGKRSKEKRRLFSFAIRTISILEENHYKFDFHYLPYQITHGNLSDNNIIVDNLGKIRGIIDWDNIRRRPRIHSITQQALSVAGGYNTTNFPSRLVQYLTMYSSRNRISKAEIVSIPDYLTYRSLNRGWIFQHYIHFGQTKSLNAIPKLTAAERWLRNNRDLLAKKLERLPFR